MKNKYDVTILQSKTGFRLVELILNLEQSLTEYHNKHYRSFKDDPNFVNTDIVKDENYHFLKRKVKMLKNDHHKALNSVTGCKGKSHLQQRKYMESEERRERYKTSV